MMPIREAVKIPEAKDAANIEWDKLKSLPARDGKFQTQSCSSPKSDERRQENSHRKFMDLGHLTNAEFARRLHTQEGRVVLREDNVQDECEDSASQMAGSWTLFLHCLGVTGEASHADRVSTLSRIWDQNSSMTKTRNSGQR